MACCGRCCALEEQFGGKVAERDLKRYRRRGPNPITRLLLAELRRSPLKGARLLDIGGGIGVIPAELADSGISVMLVEASPAYLETARGEVGPRYGAAGQFLAGDFVKIENDTALRLGYLMPRKA